MDESTISVQSDAAIARISEAVQAGIEAAEAERIEAERLDAAEAQADAALSAASSAAEAARIATEAASAASIDIEAFRSQIRAEMREELEQWRTQQQMNSQQLPGSTLEPTTPSQVVTVALENPNPPEPEQSSPPVSAEPGGGATRARGSLSVHRRKR